MTTTEKTCFKCNETLPLEAFYKHQKMKDGHLNKCIDCTKKDVDAHRQKNLERIREYDRNRGSRQEYSYVQQYRKLHVEKHKAHIAIGNALKTKKIRRLPCFVCGNEKTEAHHPDYSAPLDVVWLCPACHKQTHAMHKKITSPPRAGFLL